MHVQVARDSANDIHVEAEMFDGDEPRVIHVYANNFVFQWQVGVHSIVSMEDASSVRHRQYEMLARF